MERSVGNQKTVGGEGRASARPDDNRSMGGAETLRPEGAPLGRIDQYALVRELGGGGFGVVYLARDTVAGIEVAVKGLPPLVRNNAEELERIRVNFALVSKLHDRHIAAALVLHPAKEVSYADERVRQALRVASGDTLMVMAYAPGVTLSSWRKQFPEGKVPVTQAVEVCRQIAAALDYAHGEKVVHRDVKPSNVMVESREGRGWGGSAVQGSGVGGEGTLNAQVSVSVLDFGLAAEIRSSMSRVSQEKGDTSGTRPYMAPEQWAGRRQDGRTDQYALAALFYELVSGAVPFASAFDTGDPVIMQSAVLNLKAEPLAELSKAQNAALLRGLAKEPAERFATCGELVAVLGGAHAKTPRSKGGKWLLWLAGIAALAAASVLFIRSQGSAGEKLRTSRRDAEARSLEEAKQKADQLAAEKAVAEKAALEKGQEQKREAERLAAEKAVADERARKAEAALEKAKEDAEKEQARQREAERLAAEKAAAEDRARKAEAALEKAKEEAEKEQARQREAERLAAEKAVAEDRARMAEAALAAEKARQGKLVTALSAVNGLPKKTVAETNDFVGSKQLQTVSADDAAKLVSLVRSSLNASLKPRRLLVFSRCEGFVHGEAIAYCLKALEIAAKAGAFQADFSTEYASICDKANFSNYDAVVLNNTSGLKTKENPAFVPNLIEFVKSGRGLCVFHAGVDNFYDSPDAAEIVGGQFDGHPWGASGTWAFKVEDPANPLNRAFVSKTFRADDEIYAQKTPPYCRSKLRVLVSLDLSNPVTANVRSSMKRADNDYAVSWVRPYGGGRVFYTSFGHDRRAFLDKARLTHMLDGLQYTLGDVKAADRPVAK